MKSAKKITSVILAIAVLVVVMLFTGITSFAATSGDWEYETLEGGTANITNYTGNATNLTIPSKFGDYTVTSIDDWVFENRTSLTSVTIPNSVTRIGDYAFSGCSNLKTVTIPNSVSKIGNNAFYYCDSLTSITVDTGNKYYSSQDGVLFDKNKTELIQYSIGNKRTSYTIPNSVLSIDAGAFYRCSSLTTVTIPSSITSIGYGAFALCESLTSITVDAGNKYYSSQDGVLFDKDKTDLIQYPVNNKRTSYTIPNGVTGIVDDAFHGCSNLTSITIPNGVTIIGAYAFGQCSNLTSMILPKSLTTIGWAAIFDCDNLKNIYYTGSQSDWNKISIDPYSDSLENATIHYNYGVQLATPKLSSVSNVVAGVKVTWGKVTGAEKYRVFYKTDSGSWTKAGDTTSTSFTWTGAKSNTKYSFTVRCIDKDGKNYTSAYDTTGKSITFMSAPKVSVSNVVAGVKISWGKVSGAANYAIFRKTPDGSYKKIGTATGTSYTDTTAKNNTKYVYAVRCASKDGKTYTSSYNAGKSITFLSAPKISSVSNVVAGVKVSWGKVAGASNYAIFRKTPNGSYKKIGTSTSTSFVDKTAKNNTKYVYAVRCASKDGKTYTSSYNAGKSKTFMSAPTFTVSNVVAGVKISWNKVSGASNYAVFRKTANGSYKKIGTTTGTSYVDKTAKSGTKYIYTVRCASKDGKTYTSSYNAGKSKTFVSVPTFTVSKTSSGVQIKWSKVTGASNYAIFRKTANGSYKKIGTTTGTSFVDKTAKKGTKYIYTVRCASKDGKSYTSSYNAGKSITR